MLAPPRKVCLKFFVTFESSLERKTQKLLSQIYAEGVTARSPGLQCEASYPGFKSPASSTLKALLQFVSGRQ